jgi:hypothetical protein
MGEVVIIALLTMIAVGVAPKIMQAIGASFAVAAGILLKMAIPAAFLIGGGYSLIPSPTAARRASR